MLVCDDHYFNAGFIAIAKLQGIECEAVATRDYLSLFHFRGTVLIDLVSWCKCGSIEYSSLLWPAEKKPGTGFITSCKSQSSIIDLIFHDTLKIDRKSRLVEIERLFCRDLLPQHKNEYHKLTSRESEILTMRLSGMGTKKIALTLEIQVKLSMRIFTRFW